MIDGDDVLAVLIGVDSGLQERANRQMREQGIEPSFWQRHYLLPYVIGFCVGPFVALGLIAGIIGWMVLVTKIDQHLGNTGLFDIFGLIVLPIIVVREIVFACRRRHARKQQQPGNTLVRR